LKNLPREPSEKSISGGYARTDVSLSYQRDDWKLTVGVKNLFDRDYIEAPVSRTEIYPGASRTVLATLDIRL